MHIYIYTNAHIYINVRVSVNPCAAGRQWNVNMAAESSDGLPISPSEKSLTGSLASDENEKSVSRSPSGYSIREDKWPDLVVSRPRKLDAWWLPRREYIVISTWFHDSARLSKSRALGYSFAPACD